MKPDYKAIIRDMIASNQDKYKNDAIIRKARHQYLLKMNKTNAVVVNDVIYRKGEYIFMSKNHETYTK